MIEQLREKQEQLRALQRKLFEGNRAALVLVESMPGAGRGHLIRSFSQYLDPRYFRLQEVFPVIPARGKMPLDPFWKLLPAKKQLLVLSGSWYTNFIQQGLLREKKRELNIKQYLQEIAEFEEMLAADGLILAKFWLQVSKKVQKKRFKKYEKDPLESWRVQPSDWKIHKKYDKYIAQRDKLLQTESKHNWTTIDCDNQDEGLIQFLDESHKRIIEQL